ncbi:hypothetical protein DST30_11585 [Salmonella enterica subsp. enterica serovar Panama]|nr:hypothetical protein [Salmonella enterica subsp. enterica serovar Panama]
MSIFLKMMSGYDLPDENNAKPCTVLPLSDKCKVEFGRDEYGAPVVNVTYEDGTIETYYPDGNTYLTEDRRTIATYAYSEYVSPGRRMTVEVTMKDLKRYDDYAQFATNNRIAHFLSVLAGVPRGCGITRKCRLSVDDRIAADNTDKLNDFIADMGYCFVGYSTTNPMDADDVYILEFAVLVK